MLLGEKSRTINLIFLTLLLLRILPRISSGFDRIIYAETKKRKESAMRNIIEQQNKPGKPSIERIRAENNITILVQITQLITYSSLKQHPP